MGKRIRHLEYYGYADQNRYNGIFNLDLSDLYETNSEQDADISELSSITQDKADLEVVESLSGKVDTFIDAQRDINNKVIRVISGVTEDIQDIKECSSALTDSINDLVDSVNGFDDDIDALSARTDELEAMLESCCSGSSSASTEIEKIKEELSNKVSKEEADSIYASKGDVYTKEEVYTKSEVDKLVGDGIENAATQEWVRNQGYLTAADGDERYATRERLISLEDRVTTLNSDLSKQYSDLSIKVDNGLNRLSNSVQTVKTSLETLSNKHDREVSDLSGKCADLSTKVADNAAQIEQIRTVFLPSKVDKSDFNALLTQVSNLETNLGDKLDASDFNSYSAATRDKIDALIAVDATKADLTAVTQYVQSLNESISAETAQRKDSDDLLGERIDQIVADIEDIREKDVSISGNIDDLSAALEKEIADRKSGDDALLGTSADGSDVYSIHGARAYAEQLSKQVTNDLSAYTDQAIANVKVYIDDEVYTPLNDQISGKADKDYVDAVCQRVQENAASDLKEQIAAEEQARKAADDNLTTAISLTTEDLRETNTEVVRLGNILSTVTSWEPSEGSSGYTDEGNGVLDVLHREFHKLQLQFESASSINNIAYDADTNEIVITYTNIDGVKQEARIPVNNLVGEWDVNPSTSGGIRLTKERDSNLDPYILSAEVVIDESIGTDNALVKSENGLSVSKNQIISGISSEIGALQSSVNNLRNELGDKAEMPTGVENIYAWLSKIQNTLDNLIDFGIYRS